MVTANYARNPLSWVIVGAHAPLLRLQLHASKFSEVKSQLFGNI